MRVRQILSLCWPGETPAEMRAQTRRHRDDRQCWVGKTGSGKNGTAGDEQIENVVHAAVFVHHAFLWRSCHSGCADMVTADTASRRNLLEDVIRIEHQSPGPRFSQRFTDQGAVSQNGIDIGAAKTPVDLD